MTDATFTTEPSSWRSLLARLSLTDVRGAYEELVAAYTDRERIYLTDAFEERFGATARRNLTRAIAAVA